MEDLTKNAEFRKAVAEFVRTGEIKVTVKVTCSWCKKQFNSDEEFEAHRVDGKTRDDNGNLRRVCPN